MFVSYLCHTCRPKRSQAAVLAWDVHSENVAVESIYCWFQKVIHSLIVNVSSSDYVRLHLILDGVQPRVWQQRNNSGDLSLLLK